MRGQTPLSLRERNALVRILASASNGLTRLEPRQRAALDSYSEIVCSPPLKELEVVEAARAVIRVWSEINGAMKRRRRYYYPAVLVDETPAPLAPIEPGAPFIELAQDLMHLGVVEASTEVITPRLWDIGEHATEVVMFKKITDAAQ